MTIVDSPTPIVSQGNESNFESLIAEAQKAAGARDWSRSKDINATLREGFPDRPAGWLGGALAARQVRNFDEAEALLQKAILRFPEEPEVFEAVANLAQVRRDLPEAISRWQAAVERFPSSFSSHLGLVIALREARQLDEAEAAVKRAQVKFSSVAGLIVETARLAAARSSWDEAIAIWRDIQKLRPHSWQPISEIGEILTAQKKYDEAEAFLVPELERFRDRPDVEICFAQVANRRRNWVAALQLWSSLDSRFPDNPRVLTGFAEALSATKDEQKLVPVLDQLLAKEPDNPTAAVLYALIEMRQNRAAEAVRRLAAVAARSPGNQQILALLHDARLRALVDAPDGASEITANPALTRNQVNDINVFALFESLGSGCEFGLIQRKFGVEPLGLLRWGSITLAGLTKMLEHRFAGVGDTAHTGIRVEGKNYVLFDSLYQLGMQTFIGVDTEKPETLLPKLCKRQRFLARKLIEDLENAERIMVYKSEESLTSCDIDRFWRAICAYSNNIRLLLVRLADADHPSGSLSLVEDGLMVGRVRHFSNTDIAVEDWEQVCLAAKEACARSTESRTYVPLAENSA
jgi:predicted Zn-dependent protease